MDSFKPRKTATVCASPDCYRLTNRYNGLCVRHRNVCYLVDRFNLKSLTFQRWREALKPIYEDHEFGDWEFIDSI